MEEIETTKPLPELPAFPENVFRCGACLRPQGATNHWYVAYLQGNAPYELAVGMLADYSSTSEDGSRPLRIRALCGPGCVSKTVSEFLEKGVV